MLNCKKANKFENFIPVFVIIILILLWLSLGQVQNIKQKILKTQNAIQKW